MKSLAALAAFLAAATAVAQDREAPPAPGTPHDFRLPAKETIRLDNGLKATFIDYGSVRDLTRGAGSKPPFDMMTGTRRI